MNNVGRRLKAFVWRGIPMKPVRENNTSTQRGALVLRGGLRIRCSFPKSRHNRLSQRYTTKLGMESQLRQARRLFLGSR